MMTDVSQFLILVVLAVFFTFSEEQLVVQPDDVDSGQFDNLTHGNPILCTRECVLGQPPRICYYKFHLELYTVLSGACELCPKVRSDCFNPQCVTADGFERAILTVNRRMPGPSIQVCKGDTIVVDVKNQMPGSSTSIHWHGVNQRQTPWMDGVSMVTQCPILEGQTFRYRFLADAAGTYFWHSHDGQQKVDGIVGSLNVRQPDSENPLRKLYDWDLPSHTLVVQDWMHTSANDHLPGVIHRNRDRAQGPVSYLINGRGAYMKSLLDFSTALAKKTPLAKFHVKNGFRYRFRIIGSTCLSCPFRIIFQDHKLKVINLDENPLEPVEVDSVVISSGERYDVVLEADQPPAAYWILVRGLGECIVAYQAAVLIYEGSSTSTPLPPKWTFYDIDYGYTINPLNSKCDNVSLHKGICISQTRSLLPNPPRLSGLPDLRIFMTFGFYFFKNKELFRSNTFHKYFAPTMSLELSGLMNNVSNVFPPSPPLTQLSDIPPSMFCHEGSCRNQSSVCECINVIKVPLGSLVEFVLIDSTTPPSSVGLSHPFHIHGHDFYVVEQGMFKLPLLQSLPNLELRLQEEGRSVSSFLPSKDTVTVPSAGYAVVRILADNPGFWLFHCHFAYHLSTGMSAIIQVGEVSDIPPPPKDFPRCHQFLPPLDY